MYWKWVKKVLVSQHSRKDIGTKYKRSDLVLWENLEGAGGERGGRGDWDGEYTYIHG